MTRMKCVSFIFAVFCLFTLGGCVSTGTSTMGSSGKSLIGPSDIPSASSLPGQMDNLPPVKVGLLLPLSGEHAALGNAMLKSAQMALFDMGYVNFELVPRDTAQGAAQAASSVLQQGASLILGPVFANDVRAVKPVAQAANVNVIAFSTDWTLAGGNVFIMGFLPFDQVDRIIAYAAAQKLTPIGAMTANDGYGNAVASAYQGVTGRRGIPTANIQRFGTKPSDLQQAAARFAAGSQGAKSVLLAAGGTQAIGLSDGLRQSGLASITRLGTGLFDDPALANSGALEGALFAGPSPNLRAGFENRYRETYGGSAPRLTTLSYDATALAAVLAQRGFTGGDKPAFDRGSIINPNGFAGVDGIFRFRDNGMAERGLAILQFRQGRIEVVDPAPQTFQAPAF